MICRIPAAALAILLASCQGSQALDRKPYAETEEVSPTSAVPPCSQRLRLVTSGELSAGKDAEEALEEAFGAERMLGVEENVTLRREDGVTFLRISYPEDSINFGSAADDRPLGGASFYVPMAGNATAQGDATCLYYRLRFPADFDFVKGGKLPGLFAGEAPSGGDKVTGRDGWSIRLMWREDGQGELYEYIYNKKGKYGASVGRGVFTFPRGEWVDVDLEVEENDPGRRNGRARLWIDGRLVMEQNDIVYRTGGDEDGGEEDRTIGLFFSTFFGGSDEDWATPRDQHIDFGDLRLYGGGAG